MTRELLLFLAYSVLALVITAMFAREPAGLRNGNPRCEFRPLIEGTAARPYVYRALLPFTVRTVCSNITDETRADVERRLVDGHPLRRVLDNLVPGWERDFAPEYLLSLALIALGFLGFAYALRYLASGIYDAPPGVIQFLPFVAFLGLPPSFEPYGSYLYDSAVLALFTFGLALLVRRKWLAYLVVFALACLNKETTILLPAIFALHFGSEGRWKQRSFLLLLAVQGVLFLAIRFSLQSIYADNLGEPVEFHLLRNLFKFPRYSVGSVIGFLVAAGFVFHNWRAKSAFLKRTLLMLVPLFGLTVFLGYLDELRDYYEVYPAILLLMLPSALAFLDLPIRLRETSATD